MKRYLSWAKTVATLLTRGDWATLAYLVRMHWHGVDLSVTYQADLGLSPERSNWSSSSGGPFLARVLREMHIGANDSIIDIGSGKGGALITMSAFPFSRMAGVEISDALVAIARENFRRLGLSGIELICTDAAEFTDYDGFNYIYMYNPFPAQVVVPVVRHITASLSRVPRDLTVLYKFPVGHDVFVDSGCFEMVKQFPVGGSFLNVYRAR